MSDRRREQGVIKQPYEFVALLKTVFKWSSGFVVKKNQKKKKIFSFRDVKEVSDRAVITACQIAPAQEMI